jgi:anti-sigma B factor antagonist
MIDQEGIKIDLKIVDYVSHVIKVTVSGYVDQANCHLLQQTIDRCLEDKYYYVVFDLQKLVYMSSAGWGVLIGEIKRFRENNGDIKLANMGPEIYEIYQMLEFYHIISEYPSIEDALKSFNVKPLNLSEKPAAAEEIAEEEPDEQEEKFGELVAPAEEEDKEESSPEVEETVAEETTAEMTPGEQEPELEEKIENEVNVESAISEEGETDTAEVDYPEEKPAKDEKKSIFEDPFREEDFVKLSIPRKPTEKTEEVHYIHDEAQEENDTGREEKEETIQASNQISEEIEYSEHTSDDSQKIISEDELDINIEGILADEGISISPSRQDSSNYVEFNPEKYNRSIDIKLMPVTDKIRDIVGRNPELGPQQIKKMLRLPDYGGVKISYLKLKSLLKALELDTKKKRYRFYRSA